MTSKHTLMTKPNCGPFALAKVLDLDVETVEQAYAKANGKGPRWRGRSNAPGLHRAGKALGAAINPVPQERKVTLATFIEWHTTPAKRYLIRIGDHWLAIVRGVVYDQHGQGDCRFDALRRCRVTHVATI